ncbi:MAG: biotin carboxylase [Chloroflexi bacterium]|nr:biotin carboxylase [Chloroflexota bacterium]
MSSIPKRRKVSQAILQSLGTGLVPRKGVEHIAIGRQAEMTELQNDLGVIADGGATFRLIVGRYGAGKSFMLQLLRTQALNQRFVVADADFSPQHRLTGSKGEGLALYRELLGNLSTKTRPDGNAFGALIEKWLSNLQSRLAREGIAPDSDEFDRKPNGLVHQVLGEVEAMTHGYDFADVLNAYTRGHRQGDDELKAAALRWLRGEYHSKTEARLGLRGTVRVMIDDATWYDNLKLIAYFARQAGYRGLLIFLDEAVNLSKISNRQARENNYLRLLAMMNDTLQGNAEYLGIYIGATPEAMDDRRRGFYSNEALETRLRESRFSAPGLRDLMGPVLRLEMLSEVELRQLLQTVRDIHVWHHRHESRVDDGAIQQFLAAMQGRIGADSLLTPREVLRDFVTLLNLLRQNPQQSFDDLLGKVASTPSEPPKAEAVDSLYADFSI